MFLPLTSNLLPSFTPYYSGPNFTCYRYIPLIKAHSITSACINWITNSINYYFIISEIKILFPCRFYIFQFLYDFDQFILFYWCLSLHIFVSSFTFVLLISYPISPAKFLHFHGVEDPTFGACCENEENSQRRKYDAKILPWHETMSKSEFI